MGYWLVAGIGCSTRCQNTDISLIVHIFGGTCIMYTDPMSFSSNRTSCLLVGGRNLFSTKPPLQSRCKKSGSSLRRSGMGASLSSMTFLTIKLGYSSLGVLLRDEEVRPAKFCCIIKLWYHLELISGVCTVPRHKFLVSLGFKNDRWFDKICCQQRPFSLEM